MLPRDPTGGLVKKELLCEFQRKKGRGKKKAWWVIYWAYPFESADQRDPWSVVHVTVSDVRVAYQNEGLDPTVSAIVANHINLRLPWGTCRKSRRRAWKSLLELHSENLRRYNLCPPETPMRLAPGRT